VLIQGLGYKQELPIDETLVVVSNNTSGGEFSILCRDHDEKGAMNNT
jgi:hypothetical protein